MKLKISFDEVSEYVKAHYGKCVVVDVVSERELRVTYEQKVLFTSAKVSVNLKVEDVRPDGLTLVYDGAFGVDLMIAGALKFLKYGLPELSEAVVPEDGHRIRVELGQIPQAQKALETLALKNVHVTDDGVVVEAALR